ncbi:MAG: hypothetical protein B6I19_01825 [Bacteroidetes bacterium 4572_114]|nr:MAG: hypothetical protein B6I19_01825 [Bacteroidetes bacterium 4572_114]
MKNYYFLLLAILSFLFSSIEIYSQEKTRKIVNGKEVIFVDGLPLIDEKEMMFLESLPVLELPDSYRDRVLPESVDNSELPYFRSIFNQSDLECGQASAVAYTYTYEIDRLRNLPANVNDNLYPTHWVFNWSNRGNGTACPFFDSWTIIKHAGTPNVTDYGGSLNYGGVSRWMSGYDEYYNALKNRLWDFYSISLKDEDGLNTLRHWINDHLDGSETGGVANIYISYGGVNNTLPSGTPEAGKYVITTFGSYANHALCVVGYHDSIRWDYNNDGQYTNHLDINNDGIVDFRDWEIGGVKLANSYYASSWGNAGFAYCTYNALCRTLEQGGVWNQSVGVINAKDTPDPQLTFKATLTHDSRNKIKVMAGVSSQPNATEPEFIMEFPILNYQGGDKYMQGGTSQADKTLEFGLDVSSLLGYIETGADATFFLMVNEADAGNAGTGIIDSWSVMDYTNGLVEYPCPQTNVPLVENGLTTLDVGATINFDPPEVLNMDLPAAVINEPYAEQMLGTGGTGPYRWKIRQDYDYTYSTAPFPNISQEQLYPNNSISGHAEKEIDFGFPFYGKVYNTLYPHADGFIMFEPGEHPWTFITDEFNVFKNVMNISPYMCKPNGVNNGGGIWYEGDASKATFRWKAVEYGTNNILNFAVSLYPDGTIEFYYGDINSSAWNEWHSGVSEGDAFNFDLLDISSTFNIPPNTMATLEPDYSQTEMEITEQGLFHGTPTVPYEAVDIDFFVEDVNGLWSTKTLPFFTDGINSIVIREVTVAAGNDNIIEYGESVGMTIELQNISGEAIDATEMTISIEDEYVTLTDDAEALATFGPGETIVFEDAFAFDVSLEVPNNHDIIFATAIEAEAETYESHIYLKAYSPDLQFAGITFDDGNNGYLEPGETVQVYVDLKNYGGGTAYNLELLFENPDPYITVNEASFTEDELPGYGTVTAQFGITIDGSTPISHTTTFNVSAVADYGFSANDSFVATIGMIFEDFESGNFDMYDWGFSGDADWSIDTENPYEGIYCMKSGDVDDYQSSHAHLTIDVFADGQISFYYKVSSEATYDFLRFYIDGNEKGAWEGEVGWAEATFDVQAGEHTFKWSYEKDYSVSNGGDCAWIDFIIFPPMALQTMTCYAGQDMEVCENDPPTMNAAAANYQSLLWVTSGDGRFSVDTILNPVFTPGPGDISNGFVELTLEVSNGAGNTLSDAVTVYFSHLPVVYAGPNTAYCKDVIEIEIFGTTSYSEQFEWATSGDGTFEDATAPETIYWPGANDLATGNVTLTLTGFSIPPCTGATSHQMKITFRPLPVLTFNGIDQFCHNSPPHQLNECSPAGGEYSGPGVEDGWFYPDIAGEGEHEINYHYVNPLTLCANDITFIIIVLPSQVVDLPIGWSGISSFLMPVSQDIPEMFSGIENQLLILYNLDGSIYYPGGNLIPTAAWDIYSGYCIKMAQPMLMGFCGDYLQDINVPLSEGWNLAPMLSKNPVSCEFIFGLNDDIMIVKEVAGSKVFWEEMGINTLSLLLPGQAYFVYCTAETSISYPAFSDGVLLEEKPVETYGSPFGQTVPTPSSHILAFTGNSISGLKKGDVIGAFNPLSVCPGQTVIYGQDKNISLTIYGDDPYTETTDGMINGENISYKLYRPSDDTWFNLELTFDPDYRDGNTFSQEGISVVTDVVLSPLKLNTICPNRINPYQNPTSGTLHITGIDGKYQVEIF